jgi:hypothetical protein
VEAPARPPRGHSPNHPHVDSQEQPGSGEEMVETIHRQRPQHPGYDSRYDKIHRSSNPSLIWHRKENCLFNNFLADSHNKAELRYHNRPYPSKKIKNSGQIIPSAIITCFVVAHDIRESSAYFFFISLCLCVPFTFFCIDSGLGGEL